MNNIDKKIIKIDELLKDEEKFNLYVENIEKTDAKVSEDLKFKILNNLSKEKPKKKISYINIMKIAACTIFAIVVCELAVINDDTFRKEELVDSKESKITVMYTNMKTKLNDINGIMLSPIIFERRDNK